MSGQVVQIQQQPKKRRRRTQKVRSPPPSPSSRLKQWFIGWYAAMLDYYDLFMVLCTFALIVVILQIAVAWFAMTAVRDTLDCTKYCARLEQKARTH
jgi:hypothetical protein